MHIPLVYEHLFYKYFVRLSVGQATKGKRASLLMDVVIMLDVIIFSCLGLEVPAELELRNGGGVFTKVSGPGRLGGVTVFCVFSHKLFSYF